MTGTPSSRFPRKAARAVRHPNPVPHILVPRCQAAKVNGDQCKHESGLWEFCALHREAGQCDS